MFENFSCVINWFFGGGAGANVDLGSFSIAGQPLPISITRSDSILERSSPLHQSPARSLPDLLPGHKIISHAGLGAGTPLTPLGPVNFDLDLLLGTLPGASEGVFDPLS